MHIAYRFHPTSIFPIFCNRWSTSCLKVTSQPTAHLTHVWLFTALSVMYEYRSSEILWLHTGRCKDETCGCSPPVVSKAWWRHSWHAATNALTINQTKSFGFKTCENVGWFWKDSRLELRVDRCSNHAPGCKSQPEDIPLKSTQNVHCCQTKQQTFLEAPLWFLGFRVRNV